MTGFVASCAPTRGTPLYSADQRLVPETEVAQLHGDVDSVDGRQVSDLGRRFELLPGCYILGLPTRWARGDANGAVSATLPPWRYAVPMRAGHRYSVRIDSRGDHNAVQMLVDVAEYNPEGVRTRQWSPITNTGEIESCQQGDTEADGG